MAYFLLKKTKKTICTRSWTSRETLSTGDAPSTEVGSALDNQNLGVEHPIPLIPGQHSHPSNIGKVEFLKAEAELVKAAVDNPILPPRVFLGEMSNRMAGIDSLPKSGQAFLKSVQRARLKSDGFPQAPTNYEKAVTLIPDSFRLTKSHEFRFLIYGIFV